jgi:hypothetical protein
MTGACDLGRDPVGPGHEASLPSPPIALVLGTAAPAIPQNNEAGYEWVSTGIQVPTGEEATVTVTGFLHYEPNPNRPACSPTPPVEPPMGLTTIGPAGYPPTPGYIYTGHGVEVGGTEDFRWDHEPRDPSAETVTGRVTGPGVIMIRRPAGFPGSCYSQATGYQPDYFVSGTQTLTVHVEEITVTCAPSPILRGTEVTCNATPPPGASQVTVRQWRFASPLLSDTIIVDTTLLQWAGPAATSGTVMVRGDVDGVVGKGSTSLTVTARDWTQDTVRFRVEDQFPNALPEKPTREGELGDHAGFAQATAVPEVLGYIVSGPNTGVFFAIRVPLDGLSRIRMNRIALSSGSAFYFRQPAHSNDPNKCTRSQVVPFLPLAEAHEGLTLSPTSHAGVFRNELNRLVPQAVEHVVALNNITQFINRVDSAAAPGIAAAHNASRDQINGGTVPPVVYCKFKYF